MINDNKNEAKMKMKNKQHWGWVEKKCRLCIKRLYLNNRRPQETLIMCWGREIYLAKVLRTSWKVPGSKHQ